MPVPSALAGSCNWNTAGKHSCTLSVLDAQQCTCGNAVFTCLLPHTHLDFDIGAWHTRHCIPYCLPLSKHVLRIGGQTFIYQFCVCCYRQLRLVGRLKPMSRRRNWQCRGFSSRLRWYVLLVVYQVAALWKTGRQQISIDSH